MKGQAQMDQLAQFAILVPIALILFVAVGAVAIGLVFDTNTTAWDTATTTIWNLLPIIAVVAFFVVLVAVALLRRK